MARAYKGQCEGSYWLQVLQGESVGLVWEWRGKGEHIRHQHCRVKDQSWGGGKGEAAVKDALHWCETGTVSRSQCKAERQGERPDGALGRATGAQGHFWVLLAEVFVCLFNFNKLHFFRAVLGLQKNCTGSNESSHISLLPYTQIPLLLTAALVWCVYYNDEPIWIHYYLLKSLA